MRAQDERFAAPTRSAEGLRRLLLVLEGVLGLNALGAGLAFVARPDGTLLGMAPGALAKAPFGSYLVPGLLLAGVLGGLNLWAFALTLKRRPLARFAALLAGGSAVVFEAVEVALIPYSWLQPAVAVWGLLIVAVGLLRRG